MDDETRFRYKEGHGRFVRPQDLNLCYYRQIIGTWSRGILHGKRIEYQLNLNVFPKGYYLNKYPQSKSSTKVDNLSIVGEVKKGIFNGPASILVNGKKVAQTKFQD